MPIVTHEHRVDLMHTRVLMEKVLDQLRDEKTIDAEMAVLLAYTRISEAVRGFSDRTREARALLVLRAGSAALCEVIARVGALKDDEVDALVASASPASTMPYDQNAGGARRG